MLAAWTGAGAAGHGSRTRTVADPDQARAPLEAEKHAGVSGRSKRRQRRVPMRERLQAAHSSLWITAHAGRSWRAPSGSASSSTLYAESYDDTPSAIYSEIDEFSEPSHRPADSCLSWAETGAGDSWQPTRQSFSGCLSTVATCSAGPPTYVSAYAARCELRAPGRRWLGGVTVLLSISCVVALTSCMTLTRLDSGLDALDGGRETALEYANRFLQTALPSKALQTNSSHFLYLDCKSAGSQSDCALRKSPPRPFAAADELRWRSQVASPRTSAFRTWQRGIYYVCANIAAEANPAHCGSAEVKVIRKGRDTIARDIVRATQTAQDDASSGPSASFFVYMAKAVSLESADELSVSVSCWAGATATYDGVRLQINSTCSYVGVQLLQQL